MEGPLLLDDLDKELLSIVASFVGDARSLRQVSRKWKTVCDALHPPGVFALCYGRAVEAYQTQSRPLSQQVKTALMERPDSLGCFSTVSPHALPYDFYSCFGPAKFKDLARKERCPKCDCRPASCKCACSCSRRAHPVNACPEVIECDAWSDDYRYYGPCENSTYRNSSRVHRRYDEMTDKVVSVARTPSVDFYARTKAKDAEAVAYLGRCIQRLVRWGHLREDRHLNRLSCSAIIRRAHKANDRWNCSGCTLWHTYCDCSRWHYGDKRCECDNVRLFYNADQVELDPDYSIDCPRQHGHVETY
ncbi:hypothetical protein ml_495 [Mollivirus sibericum]|uniref:hypothetical protein n=1 Tax=Mollivirus sibericum TaxID=1678078 RepID=UPI0006B2EB30|nr:hypothetical protein ml_495 [Mollivirus sibericum]ALD62297.1 hypothetical protein ml_495 [Mollivirus sibericum]